MLPYFIRYDHRHNSRWGPVYLTAMFNFPGTVLAEIKRENFVVNHSDHEFDQVIPDQTQECLNRTGGREGE